MRQFTALVLFAFLSGSALAQPDNEAEVQRLITLLDVIRQEQLSVYQQFRMTEALQRSEMKNAESGSPVMAVQEGRPPTYEEGDRAKQEYQKRLKFYADEMRRLSDRYRELGNQGAGLVEEIRNLALTAR